VEEEDVVDVVRLAVELDVAEDFETLEVDELVVTELVEVLDETDDVLVDELVEVVGVVEVVVAEVLDVVVVVEAGAGNMTTLLLPVSVTQTFPEESATTPVGSFSELCPIPLELVPKLCWPSTPEALMPSEKGPTNSRTLELPRSEIQRLPVDPIATPVGFLSELAEVPPLVPVKPDWPRTTAAAMPIENEGAYSRTRLLPESATQRSPAASKARATGVFSPPCPACWA